jgi:hypothetical protein
MADGIGKITVSPAFDLAAETQDHFPVIACRTMNPTIP